MGDYRFEVEEAVRRLETLAQDPSRAPVHLQDGQRATAANELEALVGALRVAWDEYIAARRRGHA